MAASPEFPSLLEVAARSARRSQEALDVSRESIAALLALGFMLTLGGWILNLDRTGSLVGSTEAAEPSAEAGPYAPPPVNLSALASRIATIGDLSAADVTALQVRLRDLGFAPGPVDGIAGHRTLAALNAYRSSVDLPDVDRVTRANAGDLLR